MSRGMDYSPNGYGPVVNNWKFYEYLVEYADGAILRVTAETKEDAMAWGLEQKNSAILNIRVVE